MLVHGAKPPAFYHWEGPRGVVPTPCARLYRSARKKLRRSSSILDCTNATIPPRCCMFGQGFQTRPHAMAELVRLALENAARGGYVLPSRLKATISHKDAACPEERFAINVYPSEADCTARPFPDNTYISSPESGIADFSMEARAVAAAGASPAERRVCGWAGNPSTGKDGLRRAFVRLASEPGSLLEAHVPRVHTVRRNQSGDRLAVHDMVARWACLVDLPGFNGYSARVPLLLHSGRPLLLSARKGTRWYEASNAPEPFLPWQHYVPVRADLGDVQDKARWALGHEAEARAIALRAQAYARRVHTREAAVAFVRRALFPAWSRPS